MGPGSSILVGGAGNDNLVGGGCDVLIGGVGADILNGGGNDDLLIAGATAYDANPVALWAVLAEWGGRTGPTLSASPPCVTAAGSTVASA